MNKRQYGTNGEAIAEKYLRDKGYKILVKNYRCKLGEVDLIVLDQKTTVFVEVKRRYSNKWGAPSEAVEGNKQRQIVRVAFYYAQKYHLFDMPMRFDVIEVMGSKVNHMVNAFQVPSGRGYL